MERKPSDRRVAMVLCALKKRPELRVKQLAFMTGLSPSRLQHLVRNDLGVNLRTYKQQRQLQRARRLLLKTTLHLKEIRSQCGIPDPANFNRLFKRHFGMTPGAFRRHAG